MHNRKRGVCILMVALVAAAAVPASAGMKVRIKDVARIKNVRRNQLYGMGLVIGLNGTGDGGRLARQLTANMLQKLRISVPETELASKNVAAVIVTAEAPSFLAEGSRLDVLISSIGDAKSLEGGTLLQTPLQAADGLVYAVAQGPLSVGGFAAAGKAASVRKNHPTVARIPGGAVAERSITTVLRPTDDIEMVLRHADFTTAVRMAAAVNECFGGGAHVVDGATVRIKVPPVFQTPEKIAEFVAGLQELQVVPDSAARVVVNERTGTIVAGEHVKISTVAISHGNLTIAITEKSKTSQPLPFSSGETSTDDSTDIETAEEKSGVFVIRDAATIAEVARALNLLGVTPRDMISIFQALKKAGALQGELVVI